MRAQGPYLPELVPWLLERAPDHDVVSFFTYLYYPTWAGLPAAAVGRRRPSSIRPPTTSRRSYLDLFRTMFHHPSAFGFLTEEEAALVERRFRPGRPYEVVGVGIDVDRHEGFDGAAFRDAVRARRPALPRCSSAGSTRPRGRRSSSTTSPPTSSATPGRWPWPSSATPCARSTRIPT